MHCDSLMYEPSSYSLIEQHKNSKVRNPDLYDKPDVIDIFNVFVQFTCHENLETCTYEVSKAP